MVGLTDNEGDTALHIAVRYGHVDVERNHILVAIILDKSVVADHIHRGPCGRTALHAAALAAATYPLGSRTTEVILRKGKNLVKARDENGRTPLHYAAHFGRPRMVEVLAASRESDSDMVLIFNDDRVTVRLENLDSKKELSTSTICPTVTGARRVYKLSAFNLMIMLGLLAEAALVVAFVTGLYAVLNPALTLAIATCIIILCFFIAFFFFKPNDYVVCHCITK
ncbi:hypothetical protein F3Y22_tig00112249pilonHSYRG00389 [Hibiscus syriacus]|uniref:Uncharacterized protein n=1 Tax=Hibiscus syriacus TaxID=106335 RepID=A0A6A2X3U5_HIBSY|nr:hypothetical protein F3Y22_tig00112249pilonHSYRG00389 [Hibiscus syriacus]